MPVHFAILVIGHFIADFVLQSRHMAKNKTIDTQWLLRHGMIQYAVFFILSSFVFDSGKQAVAFSVFNALIHCAIDWHIWKGYKLILCYRMFGVCGEDNLSVGQREFMGKFQFWDDYWFYTFIGVDQLLHILTLIFLYQAFV